MLALLVGAACARSADAPWVTRNLVFTRLGHFLQHDQNSSGWYRLDMWRRVGADISVSPGSLLLGYGPSSYLLVASRSYVPAYSDGTEPAQFMDSTHNIFGDALVDSGLLGLAALAAILFLGFRTGLRALRRATAPAQRAVLTTALVALVGYVVQGMFLFDHVITLIYLCLTLGLITAASRADWGAEIAEIDTGRLKRGRSEEGTHEVGRGAGPASTGATERAISLIHLLRVLVPSIGMALAQPLPNPASPLKNHRNG